jgi:hypothetical protein
MARTLFVDLAMMLEEILSAIYRDLVTLSDRRLFALHRIVLSPELNALPVLNSRSMYCFGSPDTAEIFGIDL